MCRVVEEPRAEWNGRACEQRERVRPTQALERLPDIAVVGVQSVASLASRGRKTVRTIEGEIMLAVASTIARIFGLKVPCLGLVLALAAGAAAGAQSAAGDADAVDAAVGGIALRLTAPPGQALGATALDPIYVLHDVAGEGLEALAVYLSPETARFFASQGQMLPSQGLMSTLIITDRELESRYVDDRALRDVLVDELKRQRQLQAFLASQRFGSQGLRVSLPETRLLTVEEFLILEGNERLLPESGRRISYCVEAFLALRNRPILASTCLTKPEVSTQDMFALETSVGAWARRLLADNPSSRSPAPTPTKAKDGALRPTADVQPDPVEKRLAVVNLRSAAERRRGDVVVASALLAAQLPADLRAALEKSNNRFGSNVDSVCGGARDAALAYQCQLVAFDRRLRALEQCTETLIGPLLRDESVEPVAGRGSNT
jgi:hypothetical protein